MSLEEPIFYFVRKAQENLINNHEITQIKRINITQLNILI